MSKIRHIISSPRGAESNSIKLANAIIDRLKEKDPGAAVHIKDLTRSPFPHLEEAHLNAFFTPAEKHTAENKAAISHSDQAIAEILDADVIVIGVPMYNFGVSSTLKAWIDHMAVDFLTPYLKFMLAFIGMDDVTVLRAEGFAIATVQDTALDKGIDGIEI